MFTFCASFFFQAEKVLARIVVVKWKLQISCALFKSLCRPSQQPPTLLMLENVHIFNKLVGWQFPHSAQFRPDWWKVFSPLLLWLSDVCFFVCECFFAFMLWIKSSMVLKTRDLCRSNSPGLPYTHKWMTKFCFSCRAAPFCSFQGLIDSASLKMLI